MVNLEVFTHLAIAFTISSCSLKVTAETIKYGVVTLHQDKVMNGSDLKHDFCFPSNLLHIPHNASAKQYSVENYSDVKLCDDEKLFTIVGSRKSDTLFIMTTAPNCSIENYINYTLNNSGSGLIMISPNLTYYNINETYNLNVLAIITNKTFFKMQDLLDNQSSRIQLTRIDFSSIDGSVLIVWFIACACVFLGTYFRPWMKPLFQPLTKPLIIEIDHALNETNHQLRPGIDNARSSANANEANHQVRPNRHGTHATIERSRQDRVDVYFVLLLFSICCTFLLLVYFFYSYMVYVAMVSFCIYSSFSVFDLLNQLCRPYAHLKTYMPKILNIELHQIIFRAISIALPITWFVFRHEDCIWILQDILGMCYCIFVIQVIPMPNLKVCTVLLSLLFIYDIFFVFITPYITPDGKSVMEALLGESPKEMLPVFLKIPYIQSGLGAMSLCFADYNFCLLGYGDIMIPGFLVCFAYNFDVVRGVKGKPYFIATFVGYGCGLAIATLILLVTKVGQPALLYIVPSTLIPIYTVAIIRRELRDIWNGCRD